MQSFPGEMEWIDSILFLIVIGDNNLSMTYKNQTFQVSPNPGRYDELKNQQGVAGGNSSSSRHSRVVSVSRETNDQAPPSPMRRATGVQEQNPPLSPDMEKMRTSGTKILPSRAIGAARRRLEPAGSGIVRISPPGALIGHFLCRGRR
jgi:hypothetical protein